MKSSSTLPQWILARWTLAVWIVLAVAASASAQEAPPLKPHSLIPPQAPAQAPARPPINVDVMITHISDRVGEIDQRAKRLDEQLRDQFRYESLEVLERHQMVLDVDEVGTVKLPTGQHFQARPIDVNRRGVLMSVGVEGSLQTDVRVPSGHLVVIGAERYKDGKLVISVEPEY